MNSDKPKILILCNDFPPVNSIGADRPYSWYKYLNEFGVEPIIITKNWIAHDTAAEQEIDKETLYFEQIIKVGERKTPSIWFRNKFQWRFSIFRKALTFIEKTLYFHFNLFDPHYNIYTEAQKYIEHNKISLLIVTGEPFILFKYGHLLNKKFGTKWVADYRDGWYLNHVTSISKNPITKFFRFKEFYSEKKIMKSVDLITTVDPELAGRLKSFLNKKVQVSYNGFWNFYENSELLNETSDKNCVVLTHTGTLTNGQRIEVLLDCLLKLKRKGLISSKNIRLNLIGLDHYPDQMKRIHKYLLELEGIVRTTKRISKKDAILENLKSDYLINFTDPNLSAIYAKTYNYIACGKPILVIPGDNGLLNNLVTEHNLGTILNTAKEIEDFITTPEVEFKPDPKNLEFFTRRNQTKIMSEIIKTQLINYDQT